MAEFPENTDVGEQVFYFNERAYNDEFERNDRGRPDLFDLLLNEIDDYDIQKDRLTEFFDHYYNKLDTEDYITGAVFRDGYQKFYIPDYQRPFSWDTEEHRQFWLEIKDHLDGIDRARAPELYMGSIYISDEDSEFEVIDGQQRLISLTILFKTIQRYLDLVSTGCSGSDLWEFVEFCYGPRFLGELLYRANDKPVVEAKEDDREYLNLIFESEDEEMVSTAEAIDPPTEGRTIRLDTLLTDKLGVAPNVVEKNLDSHDPSDTKYYRKPHEYMLKAKEYYESAIGEYIGTSYELINEDFKTAVLEASSAELRLQTTTESVPLASAHVKFEIDGTLVSRETTNKKGECTLSIEQSIEESATITITKFDKSQTLTFEDPSTIETERIIIKNVDIGAESFQLQIVEQDEPKHDRNVCVGGVNETTDTEGKVEFSLNDLSPDSSDGRYQIEASIEKLKFEGIDELKQLEIPSHPFTSDEQRARALINIMQVLLHSMRFVHAKFRDQDQEYKIEVFQSLNDRGKRLGIADIIRARVMASQATEYGVWEEITKRFDRDGSDIQDFLENYIIATQGVSSANESDVKALFALRRSETADVTPRLLNDPDNFLEELETYSKRYREIIDHKLPTDLSEIRGLHNDSSTQLCTLK